jgi:hypothetical protein
MDSRCCRASGRRRNDDKNRYRSGDGVGNELARWGGRGSNAVRRDADEAEEQAETSIGPLAGFCHLYSSIFLM